MHVNENSIVAYVAGGLPAHEMSQFREHLDHCPDCLALVAVMVKERSPAVATTVHARGSTGTPPPIPRDVLTQGARVGPYVIERLVGVGGMGVVYAATDPRLDRVVALKLIRQQHGVSSEALAERMRRESKALARLSHPNVTAVYELGAADDEIYVVMEYVAGTNLRAWLHEKKPEARDIIATFSRAGRGLAAAHAAGLVHRDFKPDNVLMGADGSVKVTDFGLARLAGDVRASVPASDPAIAEGSGPHELTMTGAIVGTPAYMASEQFLGGTVDARSDQFAFCVALYEALYGERPFRGANFEEVRGAVLAGRITPPRGKGRVRRALLRGLAKNPGDRFASMDLLLAAIAPRRGRLTLAVGLTAAAAAALAATVLARAPAVEPCKGTTAEVVSVWNPQRRDAIRTAFTAARGAAAWPALERKLESYVTGWAAMHGGACEATRVHRQQSEAVLDLRMTCLARRRSELDALLGVFERADANVVAHAHDAVASLTEVSACADVEALGRRTGPPRDLAARRRYDVLRGRLDQARALVNVARFKDAKPAIDSIVADAGTAEFPAIEAEAQQTRGKTLSALGALDEAEQALFRAFTRAQAARFDDMVATAAVDLAYVVGFQLQRVAEGMRWADIAAAATDATGNVPLAARLGAVRAAILQREGKLVEAEAIHRKALELARHSTKDGMLEGEVLEALGSNLGLQGKFDDALPLLEQALVSRIHHYGAMHSLTANSRMNLANALTGLRRFDAALVQYREALAVREELFGRDGYEVSTVLSNMGQMLQETKRPDEARPLLERALAIREKFLGPDHPSVARTLNNIGYVQLDANANREALATFARAAAIIDKKLGANHPARGDDLEGTGVAWAALKHPAKAIEPFEQLVRLRSSHPDPAMLAGAQAKLGYALWQSGRDRARAKKLGIVARKVLADAGWTDEVADLDGWLPR